MAQSIGDSDQDLSVIPVFAGNISFPATIANAGLDFNCADGTCFSNASSFTCSMGFFDDSIFPTAILNVATASTACLLDHTNVQAYDSLHLNVSGDMQQQPIQDYSEAILLIRSNITYSHISNDLTVLGNISLPSTFTNDGEFATFEFDGVYLSLSLCFMTLGMDLADVNLSADRDLVAPIVIRNNTAVSDPITYATGPNKWITDDVLPLFGIRNRTLNNGVMNPSARGTYQVGDVTNLNQTVFSGTMARLTTQFGTETLADPGQTMLISSSLSGSADLANNPQMGALFDDILARTGRAGLAFQTMMTTAAALNLGNAQPLMNIPFNVTVVPSQVVLAPGSWRGFVAVSAILLASLLCTNIITGLYLMWTRHSLQGQYWHALSQVVSDDTQWILDQSTEQRDDVVMAMLRDQGDKQVRIRRAFGEKSNGRVQLRDMTRGDW